MRLASIIAIAVAVSALPCLARKDKAAKQAFIREYKDRTLTLRTDVRYTAAFDGRIATTASPQGMSHPNAQEAVQFPAGAAVTITNVYAMPTGNLRLGIKAAGFKPLKSTFFESASESSRQMDKYMGYVVLVGPNHRASMAQVFDLGQGPPRSARRGAQDDPPQSLPTWSGGPFGLNWGDDLSTAAKKSGLVIADAGGTLIGTATVKIGRLSAAVSPSFDGQGRLWQVQLLFRDEHDRSSLAEYAEDLWHVKGLLESKYGPGKQRQVWFDDLYKGDPQQWVYAVSLGHLHWAYLWESTDTRIELGLLGGDREVTHRLLYTSKALGEAGIAERKRQAAERL